MRPDTIYCNVQHEVATPTNGANSNRDFKVAEAKGMQ